MYTLAEILSQGVTPAHSRTAKVHGLRGSEPVSNLCLRLVVKDYSPVNYNLAVNYQLPVDILRTKVLGSEVRHSRCVNNEIFIF
jgi:hypothetical protein